MKIVAFMNRWSAKEKKTPKWPCGWALNSRWLPIFSFAQSRAEQPQKKMNGKNLTRWWARHTHVASKWAMRIQSSRRLSINRWKTKRKSIEANADSGLDLNYVANLIYFHELATVFTYYKFSIRSFQISGICGSMGRSRVCTDTVNALQATRLECYFE